MKINIQCSITELHIIFKQLNVTFFDGDLPEPAILIQGQGKRKDALGWCSTKEFWENSDGSEKRYEITICAEYLNRPVEGIAETMLHEMCHLSNAVNGVKDYSRGGTYHNEKFAKECNRRGLHCEQVKKYGYALTSLKDETKDLIKTFNIKQEAFELFRLPVEGKPKAGQATRTYKCKACGTKIKSAKELHILCMDCNEQFKTDEEDDD